MESTSIIVVEIYQILSKQSPATLYELILSQRQQLIGN